LRHVLLAVVVAASLLLAWRVRELAKSGRALHAREVAARAMAERILRAEESRRLDPPADARLKPYEFLGALVSERRIDGLEPVASAERDLWRAGGYLFHVRLLNRLGRPIPRRPADSQAEPGLGSDFELWAWPAERQDVVLALYFGSDAGFLLQGENGAHAGQDAHPEDASATSPAREVERSESGATREWITLADIRDA